MKPTPSPPCRTLQPLHVVEGSLLFQARVETRSTRLNLAPFLGRGQPVPPPPACGSGKRCKMLPQRSPGRASAAKKFSFIPDAPDGLFWNLFGAKLGKVSHPWPLPLNPPYMGGTLRSSKAWVQASGPDSPPIYTTSLVGRSRV